jgi:hypothetical protein
MIIIILTIYNDRCIIKQEQQITKKNIKENNFKRKKEKNFSTQISQSFP